MTAIEAHSLDELVELLAETRGDCGRLVVGIDGYTGVGKSLIASTLAERLDLENVDVDHFRRKLTDSDAAAVLRDKSTLALLHERDLVRLERTVRECRRGLVIHSLFFLAIAREATLQVGSFVYVKRMEQAAANRNYWKHRYICEQTDEELERAWQRGDRLLFDAGRYYRLLKPVDEANFIFKNLWVAPQS